MRVDLHDLTQSVYTDLLLLSSSHCSVKQRAGTQRLLYILWTRKQVLDPQLAATVIAELDATGRPFFLFYFILYFNGVSLRSVTGRQVRVSFSWTSSCQFLLDRCWLFELFRRNVVHDADSAFVTGQWT